MKSLADVALVGLERVADVADDENLELIRRLPSSTPEQAFLLRLGVAAVRTRAGRRAGPSPPLAAAPAETRPPCSEALAGIVVQLCRERNLPLLHEALARMDARGLRLPASSLVDLAQVVQPKLQPAAGRVAGERGRWLAGHNPAWRWLAAAEAPSSPDERRRIWDEGSLPARLAALRALRAESPPEGRAWVESVWQVEKAAVREELLASLEQGLSGDDEPLLGRALADRAASVRAAAARLLATRETSELAARMRQRADGLLDFEPPPGGVRGVFGALKSRLGGGEAAGTLRVEPPAGFPADWAQDGLVEKPPAGTGEKAFWLTQILSLVPPRYWESRFETGPEQLIAAAAKSDWSAAVLGGWEASAALFRSPDWAAALWRSCAAREAAPEKLAALAARLFPLLASEQAEALVVPVVASGNPVSFQALLQALAEPWGDRLGEAFLASAARALSARQAAWQETYAWQACLAKAATALPASCMARALALAGPDGDAASAGQLHKSIQTFRSTLMIRQRIHEETRR